MINTYPLNQQTVLSLQTVPGAVLAYAIDGLDERKGAPPSSTARQIATITNRISCRIR